MLILASGCATVNIPNIGEEGYKKEDDESRLFNRAEELCEALDDSGVLNEDLDLDGYLTDLANQLLSEEIRNKNLNISVKVVREPSLNAFALPNGRIYVHSGMLAAIENEAQLASLLGHELTHIINRHAVKQFRSLSNKAAFISVINAPVAIAGGDLAIIFTQLAVVSSLYGYSQSHETEADEYGFNLLIQNGYDPKEAVKLFESLQEFIKSEDQKQPFFFSTHPNVASRIKNYNELILKQPTQLSKKLNQEVFNKYTQNLLLDNIQLSLHRGLFKTAERNIYRVKEREPMSALGYYWEGELFRQRQDPFKTEKKREKLEDYKKALECFDNAIKLDSQLAIAYRGKARIFEKQGHYLESKSFYQQYLNLAPDAEDRLYVEAFLKKEIR